ncbi:MAG: hypothetical protein ACRDUY_01055 [Nitriliruptorales bacterium]
MATDEVGRTPGERLVDATRFLEFADRLRIVRGRIADSEVDDQRRQSWQRRLIAVSDAAQQDLAVALDKLERLVAELDRYLGR